MPRTRSLGWSELKIGITGVAAFVLAALVIVAVGGEGGYSWQRYPLRTRFDNVLGLKEGAVVRLAGKEIGTVSSVEFVGAEVEVQFEVLKTLRPVLTTASVAQIGSLSLLGEPVIDITAGQGGTPLEDNGLMPSRAAAASIADVSDSAAASLRQVDLLLADIRAGRGTLGRILTDDALYNEMQRLTAAAADVAGAIERGQGTIGGLINDRAAYDSLKASLANLNTMTARINAGEGPLGRLLNDQKMADSLSSTTQNLSDVTGRLSRGEGTMGKLLTDQQLFDRINGLSGNMNQLAAGLNAGEGTVGQLLRDRQLYDNINGAVTEFRELLAEVKKDPRKYLRVNVSIF
jgi:phospholipid/cholesterol/gamma-HCH transport system substrate-binding protein